MNSRRKVGRNGMDCQCLGGGGHEKASPKAGLIDWTAGLGDIDGSDICQNIVESLAGTHGLTGQRVIHLVVITGIDRGSLDRNELLDNAAFVPPESCGNGLKDCG